MNVNKLGGGDSDDTFVDRAGLNPDFQNVLLTKYDSFCKEHSIDPGNSGEFERLIDEEIVAFAQKHNLDPDLDTDIFRDIKPNDPLFDEAAALCDLFAGYAIHEDAMMLGELCFTLGGRYDDLEIKDSGITVRDIRMFDDFTSSIDYNENARDVISKCAANYVVHYNRFDLDDVKTFHEALSYRDSQGIGEDGKLMIERPHELLAQVLFVKATQEALDGKRDKLTEYELSLLVSHIDTELILKNRALSDVIVSTFEDSVENPEKYLSSSQIGYSIGKISDSDVEIETEGPFFHETTRLVVLQNRDSLNVSKEKIQMQGEALIRRNKDSASPRYYDVLADAFGFMTALGYQPTASSGELLFSARQTMVEFQKRGLIGTEVVDKMYQYAFEQMTIVQQTSERGDEEILPLYLGELIPSDDNVAANFWRKNCKYLSHIREQARTYNVSAYFLDAIDPETHLPSDRFIDEGILRIKQGKLEKDDVSFLAANYDMFFAPHIGHLAELSLFSPRMFDDDSTRKLFLALPVSAQDELLNPLLKSLERMYSEDAAFISENYDKIFGPYVGHLKDLPLFSSENLSKSCALEFYLQLPKEAQTEVYDSMVASLNIRDGSLIASNYDTLLAPHLSHLKDLPLFSSENLKKPDMREIYLQLPLEARGELSEVIICAYNDSDFRFLAKLSPSEISSSCQLSPTSAAIVDEIRKMGTDEERQANQLIQFMKEEIQSPENPNSKVPRFETLSPESVASVKELLSAVYKSSALEMTNHAYEIADRLLRIDSAGALQKAERLERIFLRSDIPEFAKLYCTANILYENSINSEKSPISPVLYESDDKRSILMTDLLKSSIRSGNPSLRRYLEYHLRLDEQSQDQESDGRDVDDGLFGEFTNNKKFHTKFLGYARALGYETTRDILNAMDETRMIAHKRHIDSLERGPDGFYRIKRGLIPGDFVKGIGLRYIHTMMRRGFNCPEMVGQGAHQDVTHWDVDFGSFKEGSTRDLAEAIGESMASGYGDGVYIVVANDERFCHLESNDATLYDDMRKYEVYHRSGNNNKNFRGIRTGLGSYDVDYYVVNNASLMNRLAYEIVKSNCYIPIVNRQTGIVIFTPEDYEKMRERFCGQPRYSKEPFRYAPDLSLPETLRTNDSDSSLGFFELVSGYDDREEASLEMDKAISATILERIENSSLSEEVKEAFRKQRFGIDPDYRTGHVEVLSTGSTARQTNIPGSADYDYIWRIDREIYDKYGEQIMSLLDRGESPLIIYDKSDPDSGRRGLDIRKGIIIVNGVRVEIDISPKVKTNGLEYSSDIALADQLEHMKMDNPESYRATIANIILAKAFLKKAGAYKKHNNAAHSQGGLGGIGVENWILQNGGSLKTALRTFLDAAIDENGDDRTWGDFKGRYVVWDFGENHMAKDYEYPFDEFVSKNMDAGGYSRMLAAAKEFLVEG